MEREEIKKYQRLLIRYFRNNFPEKLKYQPKVIEVTEDKVVFGMMKCMGRLQISIEMLESQKSKINFKIL